MEMNSAPSDAPRTNFRRRTLLKAGAWAAPTIALSTLTPVAAASGAGPDLAVVGYAGETLIRFNAAKTRYLSQDYTTRGLIGTVGGTDPTPAGSILTVEWDGRFYGGATLTLGSGSQPVAPTQTGTIRAHSKFATYVVTQPIPVTGTDASGGLAFAVDFTDPDDSFYPDAEDAEPYVFTIVPPTGQDPNLGNNGWSAAARYGDSWNLAVTASTWTSIPVTRVRSATDGGNYTEYVRVPTAMTITNLGHGTAPAGSSSISINVPAAVDAGPSVTHLGAALNGVASTTALEPIGNPATGSYTSQILVPLLAGDELELQWDAALLPSCPFDGFGLGSGSAGLSSSPGDTDGTDNFATDPGAP